MQITRFEAPDIFQPRVVPRFGRPCQLAHPSDDVHLRPDWQPPPKNPGSKVPECFARRGVVAAPGAAAFEDPPTTLPALSDIDIRIEILVGRAAVVVEVDVDAFSLAEDAAVSEIGHRRIVN